jgi:bacterioferritin-associated ferredoxin
MAPVFIFAEQVRKVLQSGEKEIEIPPGARISAAAQELIKDNQLRIKTVPADALTTSDEPAGKFNPAETQPADPKEVQDEAAGEKVGVDPPTKAADEISEAALEDIVERVIARFKEVRGLQPTETTAKEGARVEKTSEELADADDLVICRCEEITRAEIKEAIRNGMRTLNGIKRITRAGMGLCQGQTCQRLVAQILSEELGMSAAEIDPTTARGPVRPLRLEVFANS